MSNYRDTMTLLRSDEDITSVTFVLYNASTSRYARVRSVEVENTESIAEIRDTLRHDVTATNTLNPADMRTILKSISNADTRLGLIRLLASLELQQVNYPNAIHAIGLRVNH